MCIGDDKDLETGQVSSRQLLNLVVCEAGATLYLGFGLFPIRFLGCCTTT